MKVFGDYRLKVYTDGKTEVYKNKKLIATYETEQAARHDIWNGTIEKEDRQK